MDWKENSKETADLLFFAQISRSKEQKPLERIERNVLLKMARIFYLMALRQFSAVPHLRAIQFWLYLPYEVIETEKLLPTVKTVFGLLKTDEICHVSTLRPS